MTLHSAAIRRNVSYSVLEYVWQPAMMLMAAPILLKALGVQQYGTWMLVNSIAAAASGLGGGFGDGATKYVSMYRGSGDPEAAMRSLRAVLAVNCGFGLLAAVSMAICAPWLIRHAFTVEPDLQHVAVVALRISAALLVVRFAEAVFTAALRGLERYRPMVIVSVLTRTVVVVSALTLALDGYGLVGILWATLTISIVSLTAQAWLTGSAIPTGCMWRLDDIDAGIREVFAFGAFTWTKSTLGVLIGYADRLLVAGLLGTGPLAFYSLCNQLTQPVHALIAAAFNFIFPNFSAKTASGNWAETKRDYRHAAAFAAVAVLTISGGLIVSSRLVLRLWLGAAAGAQYRDLLVVMAMGNGLLALSVVPHYAALALGRARALAIVSFVAGALSLASGYWLIRHIGLLGAGFAKIVAGAVFLSLFGIVQCAFTAQKSQRGKTRSSASGAATFDIA